MAKVTKNYQLKIPSQTDNLELIRNFVSGVAKKVGFDAEESNKIELAVDEACTNVIKHAYQHDTTKDIDVAIKIDYQKLTVIVTDRGRSFEFHEVDLPDMKQYLAELRVGGLGIYLMKTLMDEVEYHSKPGNRNEVRMVKYLLGRSGKEDDKPR
ncbi:MAG TPA: ATP-binding protein [bacterium]|mgnify:CR=1 FL=1|nr:ATP-binding protein [bacterium]